MAEQPLRPATAPAAPAQGTMLIMNEQIALLEKTKTKKVSNKLATRKKSTSGITVCMCKTAHSGRGSTIVVQSPERSALP